MKGLVLICAVIGATAIACDDVGTSPEAEAMAITKGQGLQLEASGLQRRICGRLEDRLRNASGFYLNGVEGDRLHMGNAKLCMNDVAFGWEVPSTGHLLGNDHVDQLACRAALDELPIAFDPDELPGAWGMALADMLTDCSEPSE